MKYPKACFLILFAIFLFLPACGSVPVETRDAVIGALAMDVGYGVYRAVPDARTILASVCTISDFSNSTATAAQIKDALGKIWIEADKLTSSDAEMGLLAINNLNALLQTQLGNQTGTRAGQILQTVVKNLCAGVKKASG